MSPPNKPENTPPQPKSDEPSSLSISNLTRERQLQINDWVTEVLRIQGPILKDGRIVNPAESLTVAWTPDGSVRGLGSILIQPPWGDLTLRGYQFALADRINLLVARETPEVAHILLQILETEEKLVAPGNLRMVGQLLVENSDRLAEGMGISSGFPIPRGRIRHEPETMERLAEETLEYPS